MLDGVFSDRADVAGEALAAAFLQGIVQPREVELSVVERPAGLHAPDRVGVMDVLRVGSIGHRLEDDLAVLVPREHCLVVGHGFGLRDLHQCDRLARHFGRVQIAEHPAEFGVQRFVPGGVKRV